MKKLLLISGVLLRTTTLLAQWSDNGINLTTFDNVGIGTINPSRTLHLFDTGNDGKLVSESFQPGLILKEVDGIADENWWIDNNSGKLRILTVNDALNTWQSAFTIEQNSGSPLEFFFNGKVGIGTISPSAKLDVNGQIRASYNSSTGIGGSLNIDNPAGSTPSISLDQGGTRWWQYVDGDNTYRIGRGTNYNSNEATISLKGDNVGIGTTSPSARLEVYKDGGNPSLSAATVATFIKSGGTTNHAAISIIGNSSGASRLHFGDPDDEDAGQIFYDHSANYLSFKTNGVSNQMFIDSTGKVGIGTTDPLSKLSVNGHIRATEVKVLADISVPDYVFNSDYDLLSLEETKEYITLNKHLPEIPSASEIGENGIDLGDMNMRLLKKIEELTIHLIEQNERVKKLEKDLSALKNK